MNDETNRLDTSIKHILNNLTDYSKLYPKLKDYEFVYSESVWTYKVRHPLAARTMGYYEKNLQILLEYIAINYAQKGIDINFAAERLGLSRSEFCRFFKKQEKMTFIVYLNKVRIEQAAGMLLETELSCSTIGYDCGFNEPSYFSRVFNMVYCQWHTGKIPIYKRRG